MTKKSAVALPARSSPAVDGWTQGIPPAGIAVAIACRKWSAMHDGRYFEVIAENPSVYLQSLGIEIMMQPSLTVIYGSVHIEGGLPMILNERGTPVAAYPNSILAWSLVPDTLLNLQAVAITDMAVEVARGRSKSSKR